MEILSNPHTILQSLCILKKKWGMYIVLGKYPVFLDTQKEEITREAPYLSSRDYQQIWYQGSGYVFYDTQEEVIIVYNQTVDPKSGIYRNNFYHGSISLIVCSPEGKFTSFPPVEQKSLTSTTITTSLVVEKRE